MPCLLLTGIAALGLLCAAPVQDAPAARGAVAERDAQPIPELRPGEVARIAPDLVLHDPDFNRYLATVYARKPPGDEALQQLLSEALIGQAAARAGIALDEADVEAALLALEKRAREATGGEQGLAESLGANVGTDDLRAAVRLLVLHERVVRAEQDLGPDEPIEPSQLQAWLDTAIESAALTPAPLADPQAATWRGGTISKAAVGHRLRRLLPPEHLSGVLTEMIGVLLVRREAARRGIDLTPADATEEILQRDAVLRSTPGAGSVSYNQYLDAIEKRSLEELLRSDKFATEVLLRKISEQDWSEARARSLWEQGRATSEADGGSGDWEDARADVLRQLRQRTYTAIFQESRIARRF